MQRIFTYYFVQLLLLVLLTNVTSSQTITSTSTGGNWEDVNSWIGGVVPGENNDVVITSTISITSSNTKCGNLTINNGAILQNGGGLGWVTATFLGPIVNNGIIRNNPNGNQLWLNTYSDLHNNGTWINSKTNFSAGTEQKISQSNGKKFASPIEREAPIGRGSGIITALSDITFATNVYLPGQNYAWGILDMNGYNLNLEGDYIITGVVIKNIASLFSEESFQFRSTTFETDVTIEGTLSLNESNITFGKQTTVNGIIQNSGGLGWVTATFLGPIVNNGIIRNNPNGNQLWLNTYSDLHNNGTWINSKTNFSAGTEQKISQSNGKKFASPIEREAPIGRGSGIITALSDITFATNVYLPGQNYAWGILDMNGYNLNLEGDYIITGVVIKNIASLFSEESFQFRSTTFETDVIIEGVLSIRESNVTFNKAVTVKGVLQNTGPLGWVVPRFNDDLTVLGTIKNNPVGNELWPDIYGNLYNYGEWLCSRAYMYTDGNDKYLTGEINNYFAITLSGDPKSGDIICDGGLINNGELEFREGVNLINKAGSELINNSIIKGWGEIKNYGIFHSAHTLNYGDGLNAGLQCSVELSDRGNLDTLAATFYSGTSHPEMNSAVKQWWELEGDGEVGFYTMTFNYDESYLNGHDEDYLEVYQSSDKGITWNKVSNPVNTTRDTENNTIKIGTNDNPLTEQFGDYILSSAAVVGIPNVSAEITGRSDIRVGPPNRYRITYWNNSELYTDNSLLCIQTSGGVFISSIITQSVEDGSSIEIPADSLKIFDDNSTAMLILDKLAPKEAKSFDIILNAIPDNGSMNKTAFITGVELFIGYAVVGYLVDIAIEAAQETCVEYLDSGEKINALKTGLSRGIDQKTTQEGVMNSITDQAFETATGVALWPLNVLKAAVNCFKRGVWDKAMNCKKVKTQTLNPVLSSELDDCGCSNYTYDMMTENNEPIFICSVRNRNLRKVTSWDPNAKEGPFGYGANGYLSETTPMDYIIYFENKKEATAPAWKIVILDTLDENLYDISTVKVGKMSHNMGEFTQTGNVLKWEFVEIELPPNTNPPEGEGWVQFTVNPKSNLTDKTVFSNTAHIQFDLNPWIETNAYVNTLDFKPPVSTPLSLLREADNKIKINWNAVDEDGSGINYSMIYVSRNESPFTLAAISDTNSVTINAQPDMNYKVYVLSQDNVGNMEVSPTQILELVTDVESIETIPVEYRLSQNYPNPFNPLTIIEYDLPESTGLKIQHVTLKIYDILGQEVTTLVDKKLKAGSYKVKFDASSLASGIYIYKLNSGSYTQSKKMLLLK